MDTQTQIERLIELAIVQRTELKELVAQLPQLREHLSTEIEKAFDEAEPQLRAELEEWTTKQAADKTAALGVTLEAKIADLAKNLEISTQARYNAIIAEREENARLAAQAEAKIAEHAASLPSAVKEIVSAELARFPRAGEIDQLRKEFAEPRGLNPRGKWQAGETYNRLDLVTVNGDSFVSNIDGNKERPSRSATNWTLNAARGMGGGSGFTSLNNVLGDPSAGQIVGSEGGQYVRKTLVAGANITINETANAITIIGDEGQISLQDGTAAAPSLFFTNDTDTGIYRPTANTLGISTSGVQRMYVDQNGITTVGAGGTFDGSVYAANGNANNPSFSFSGDQDTGFFRHQPNEIGIALGGTQYATLTSTTFSITPVVTMASSLRVNGTTDSSSKDTGAIVTEGGLGVEKSASIGGNLTVSGTATVNGSTIRAAASTNGAARGLEFYNTGNSTLFGTIKADYTSGIIAYDAGAAVYGSNHVFTHGTTAGSVTLSAGSITATGNLTVSGGTITGGTSGMSLAAGGTNQNITLTPSGTGVINSAFGSNLKLRTSLGTTNVGTARIGAWYSGYVSDADFAAIEMAAAGTSGGDIRFFTIQSGSTLSQKAMLTESGNLGIGTTSPNKSSFSTAVTVNGATNSGFEVAVGDTRIAGFYAASSAAVLNAFANVPLYFSTNNTTRMTLAENGNFLIGTTSDGGQKLQVAGTGIFSTTEPVVTLASTAVGNIAYQLISGGGSGHALGAFKIYDSSTGYVVLNHDKPTSGGTRLSFDGAGNATFAGNVSATKSTGATILAKATSGVTAFTGLSLQNKLASGAGTTVFVIGAYDDNTTGAQIVASHDYSSASRATLSFGTRDNAGTLADALSFDVSRNATFAGNIKTAAPSGGTAATWRLGTVASVSPTSPNRTIEVEIGGTTYYIHAKTTNN